MLQIFEKANKTYLVLAVFAVLVALFYGSTLRNGFIYDDHQQVEQNIYVHSLAYLPKVFTGCTWEHAFGQCEGRAPYWRPTQSLSYLLTYQISSRPWIFHLVNLFYFLAAVFLLYLFVRTLTKNVLLSFLTAFIFLIHPINSEVVNWVSAVPELLLAIFVLLAMLFYAKDRQVSLGPSSSRLWSKHFLGAAAFYLLAMLSKEPAVLLPALFLFLDIFFFHIPVRRLFTFPELKRYFLLVGAFALFLGARLAVLGGYGQAGDYAGLFSLGERIHAFIALFGQYIGKLFYPTPLLFFHSFQKQSDFLNPGFLAAFGAVAIFAAAFFISVKRNRIFAAFPLLWIFVFLSPALLFLENLNEAVFSERYLFLPSMGFAFLAGWILVFGLSRYARSGIARQNLLKPFDMLLKVNWRVGALVLLVLFSAFSFVVVHARNNVWRNDETLYLDTLAKNDLASPIRFNLAVLLRNEKKDFESAKQEFETIVRQNPNWRDITLVYLHLGDYERDLARNEQKAIEYYKKSVAAARDWKGHFALSRLGALFASKEEYAQAVPYFCQAVAVNPDSQSSQESLNRVISLIDSTYKDKPLELYEDITQGSAFQKSASESIRYTRKECQKETCSFFFSLEPSSPEVILPFLFVAMTDKGKAVEITGSARHPSGTEAMLQTAASYESANLTFVFPTCEGIYYEVPTFKLQ